MAFLWKLCKPKKTEYVKFCPHDIEGVSLVPLLEAKTRKRILLSWCKIQDNGLLSVGNTIFKNLSTTATEDQTMSKDKLERVSDCFSCLITCAEDHYILPNPLQDKCYIMAKSIDRLVQLILCTSCINEKVSEMNSVNGITKKHYDMLQSVTIWILEVILDDKFYPCMRTAWEELFDCLKAMIDDM